MSSRPLFQRNCLCLLMFCILAAKVIRMICGEMVSRCCKVELKKRWRATLVSLSALSLPLSHEFWSKANPLTSFHNVPSLFLRLLYGLPASLGRALGHNSCEAGFVPSLYSFDDLLSYPTFEFYFALCPCVPFFFLCCPSPIFPFPVATCSISCKPA